jgi:ferric-dicitrate binding protein FerR (iron transport regulator)
MKTLQEQLRQLAAYLSGHLNDVQKEAVDRWINASPENRRIFLEAKKVWDNSGLKLNLSTDETDLQWVALQFRMNRNENGVPVIPLFRNPFLLKIAASFLIVAGLAYGFLWLSNSSTDVIIQTNTEGITHYLPDSTFVRLNAHSKLSYTKTYNKEIREVTFTGEGYFNVKRNVQKSFIVAMKTTTVRVLGTVFNITTDSAKTKLTVVDGSVLFSINADPGKSMILNTGEEAVYSENGEIRKSEKENVKSAHSIHKGNSVLEAEKNRPKSFLKNTYTSKKNALNQSVVEGTLKSSASLVSYKNVVLKITYTRANGKLKTIPIIIPGVVKAGQEIRYRKKLPDLFSHAHPLTVQVESAEAVQ